MQVQDVMNSNVQCCRVDDNLSSVGSLMWNADYGIVPILDHDDRLVGVITDRDITMAATLKHRPLWEISCAEVLEDKRCYTCHPGDNINSVLAEMGQRQVHRMPVVDTHNNIVGMVSLKDIIERTPVRSQTGTPNAKNLSAGQVVATLRKIHEPNVMGVSASGG